jgi:signal transduction histidine kinase
MKFIFVFFLSSFLSLQSQDYSYRLSNLIKEHSILEKNNKLDGINLIINSFLEQKKLVPIELQYVYYYKGLYYANIERYEEAIVFLKKSLQYKTSNSKSIIIYTDCIFHLSDIHYTIQKYTESYKYAFKISSVLNPKQNPQRCITLYSILGGYYADSFQYDKAIIEYQKAIDIANVNDKCLTIELYIKQAKRYCEKEDVANSNKLIQKGLSLTNQCNNNLDRELNVLKSLLAISIRNKNTKQAINLFEKIDSIDGLIDRQIRNQRIDSLEIVFNTKLKENQNIVLKKTNSLQTRLVEKQKKIILFVLIGLGILLLLIYNIYKLSKKQKQTNIALELQKTEIEITNKDLKRLNLLNQKIFSVISHDFKGPITTLKRMLSKDEIINQNSNISTYLKDIKQQLDQSDNMLNSLLDWAKTELMINISTADEINLKNSVATACNELSAKAQEKKITLNNTIPEGSMTNFNASVLGIVLRNVLSNAIKFSFENSAIDISYSENTIIIKDYGKGINPEKLEKLFKQNINPGLGTNLESGFGLGLYLSHELMIKNDGTISVENNKTEGCTFRIVLSN